MCVCVREREREREREKDERGGGMCLSHKFVAQQRRKVEHPTLPLASNPFLVDFYHISEGMKS